MRLIVAVVGKPKNEALAAAIREYEEPARRYWPLHVAEVKDEPVRGGDAGPARQRECERLAAAIGNAQVTACEVGGRPLSSPEFATCLQALRYSTAVVR